MRITKVKLDGTRVRIEYQKPAANAGDWDKLSISSSESPDQKLPQSLQALRDFVIDICEFKQIEKHGITGVKVLGITITWDEKGKFSLVVTAKKVVKGASVPLLVNTPLIGEPGARKPCLSPDVVRIVKYAMEQAEGYVDGIRAQMEMPLSVAADGSLAETDASKQSKKVGS